MTSGAAKAIVIGGYINGLGLVRSLAARGIISAVITTEHFDIAQYSRHVTAHRHVDDLDEQPDRLAEVLKHWAVEWSGAALFPANDGALAALSLHHEQLSRSFRIIAPSCDAARHLLDKDLMLEAARSVGIPLPPDHGPATGAALSKEIRFPVLVKPLAGHRFSARFGCKLFLARDRDELESAISRVAQAGIPCRIFEWIPGGDDCIHCYNLYMNPRGEPSAGVLVRKLRQSPPLFGVSRVAEVVRDDPALREATIELLRKIEFRGIASAEFKRDPRDGTFRFLEVNGRSVVYNALLRRTGADLAGVAWADHMEGVNEVVEPNGWRGVWINLHADLPYSILGRRQDLGFREFFAPYLRSKVHAVWSAGDPRPFWRQFSHSARMAVSAAGRKEIQKKLENRGP